MSPLPPVSHCSASAKTFIDTEKSRRHSGRRRSLRSHRKSMEKSQTKKKAMMDSCHFCVCPYRYISNLRVLFSGVQGTFFNASKFRFSWGIISRKMRLLGNFLTLCFHQFGALFCVCIRSTFILKGTDMVKGLLHEWRLSCHCQLSVSKSIIVEDSYRVEAGFVS